MKEYYFHAYNEYRGGRVHTLGLTRRLQESGYKAKLRLGISCCWIKTDAPDEIVKELIKKEVNW